MKKTLSFVFYLIVVLAVLFYIFPPSMDEFIGSLFWLVIFGLIYLGFKIWKKKRERELEKALHDQTEKLAEAVSLINVASNTKEMDVSLKMISKITQNLICTGSALPEKECTGCADPDKKFVGDCAGVGRQRINYPLIFDEFGYYRPYFTESKPGTISAGWKPELRERAIDEGEFNLLVVEKMLKRSKKVQYEDTYAVGSAFEGSVDDACGDYSGHRCPKCGKGTERHIKEDIIKARFLHETKDGDMDRRYDNNPLYLTIDYTVKCRHCGNRFTDRCRETRK
jgi:prepilin signal peptidase PulO-like enzyme (type II secretory pathway)|tara:strand:- start:60 stop:905 length:846 start_codon:yes stop_codon:yes gene_type:complete